MKNNILSLAGRAFCIACILIWSAATELAAQEQTLEPETPSATFEGGSAPVKKAPNPNFWRGDGYALSSVLFPGLGQAAQKEYLSAALQGGFGAIMLAGTASQTSNKSYIEVEDQIDEKTKTNYSNPTTFRADMYSRFYLNTALFSAYDSYRIYRRNHPEEGQHTPVPQEDLLDLMWAPYNWRYLTRITTLIPIAAVALLTRGDPGKDDYVVEPQDGLTRKTLRRGYYVMSHGIAIGEEAFFRGYLNTSFTEKWGPAWGLAGSSAAFGLAHSGTGGSANSITAGVFGAYMGWLQRRDNYRIGEPVAIHFWWDVFALTSMTRERKVEKVVPLFQFMIPL